MKKLLGIVVLGLSLVSFFINVSKAQESTTAKIDESQMYVKMTDNLPIKGKENTVYMGDKMVEQRTGMFVECLVPKFSVEEKKFGGWLILIKAEEPLCKRNEKDKGYFPFYVNQKGLKGDMPDFYHEVRFKGKKEGKYKLCLVFGGLNSYCKKKLSTKDVYYKTIFTSQQDSFQRVIEYAGKKGSIVKFIYSEFKDEMARDAFTREFEIDLNDGMTVAYKGSVFEIIEANNATITYRVVRHFKN